MKTPPRWTCLTLFAALAVGSNLRAADFEYRIEGPDFIDAVPGQARDFELRALIDHSAIEKVEDSVEAWSMSLRIEGEGFSVSRLTTDGTASEGADYLYAEKADGGVILAVVLGMEIPRRLPPASRPHTVLVLGVQGTLPAGKTCAALEARFADGLQGSGQPVQNVVTARARSHSPILGWRTVRLRPEPCSEEPVSLSPSETTTKTELSSCRPGACFAFEIPLGSPLLFDLSDADPRDWNSLYLRWGAPATPTQYDVAAAVPRHSQQRLVVPAARQHTCYILVHSDRLFTEATSVTLKASVAQVALRLLSPAEAAQGAEVSAVILGTGLRAGKTAFSLEDAGGNGVTASDVLVLSPERAEVKFLLGELSAGKYDLVAHRTDLPEILPARLAQAFEVKPRASAHPLEVDLLGHARYGYGRVSRVTLRYRNVSDEEIAAPLFRIVAPPGTELWLERDPTQQGNEILVLGTSPVGNAGRLGPGVGHEIPIVFRSFQCPGVPRCDGRFQVFLLTARESDRIQWDRIPAPAGAEQWDKARPKLPSILGGYWMEYHASLVGIATRLARRGAEASSVRALFGFAYTQALELPSSAIVGKVVSSSTGLAVEGVTVVALLDDVPAAQAVTDSRGTFAIEGLAGGTTYQPEVADWSLEETVDVYLPEDADALGIGLRLAGPGGPIPAAPSSPPGVPERPVFPPEDVFTRVVDWTTSIVSAIDPNDKDGSIDPLFGFVGLEGLNQRITIQNKGAVSAHRVEIVDQLGPGLDPASVVLREVSFRGNVISLDQQSDDRFSGYEWGGDLSTYLRSTSQSFSVRPEDPLTRLRLDVAAGVDIEKRAISWVFQTIDPVTGEPPADLDEGFLPPDDGTGRGSGYVAWTVWPRDNLAEGAVVNNRGAIQFDAQPKIYTREVSYRFTWYPTPEEPSGPVPGDGKTVDSVRYLMWRASRYASVRFDVYLAEEGKAEGLIAQDLAANGVYLAQPLDEGKRYSWRVEARNARANPGPRDQAIGPQWSFTVLGPEAPPFRRGDANADGVLNITDAVFLVRHLLFGGAPPPCADAANASMDEIVNISDPIFILNFLFLGGPPPPAPGPDTCGSAPAEPGQLGCGSYTRC